MKIKNNVKLAVATVLSLSSVLTMAIPLAHAAVQTCTWTGTTDNKFSTVTNWSGCSGAAPLAGDIIAFGQSASSNLNVLTNDLGVQLGGVISNVVSTSSQYKIDTISLAAGAVLDVATSTDCNGYPVYIKYGTLTAAGGLTVHDGHDLYGTDLAVTGNLTLVNQTGNGYLAPLAGSTVSGQVIIASPFNYSTVACGFGGGVGLETGTSLMNFTVNGLTVQNGASVAIGTSNFPVSLGGGTGTTAPTLKFYADANADQSANVDTTLTFSGAIVLTHDALVYAGDKATVNLTSAISGTAYALTMDPTTAGTVNFQPSSNDSKTPTGVQVNPVKTTTVSDDQSNTNFLAVANETLVIDGKAGYVSLLKGSILKGTGQVDGLSTSEGSIVAPGHSPGCLTSTNGLYFSGTYQAEIGGTDACTGYDQIKVTGTVNLNVGNTLEAILFGGFVPKVGQSYTIIDNDAADAVTGTFTGIAEGGDYTNQGVTYTVTYKGGDGNDVVLTVKSVDASKLPAKPDTGFALVAAHPLVSLATTTLAALGLVFAARKLKPVKN